MDILGKIKDWLTMGMVPLVGLAIASGIVLFAPIPLLQTLGLDTGVEKVRPYLGGAFLLSISVLTAMGVKGVWDALLKRYLQDALRIRFLRKELHALTEDEKAILRPYIERQTRSQDFSMQDGVVLGLQQRKIIIRIGSIGQTGFGFNFPFQIQPWAWEYLNMHPELVNLEGTTVILKQ